MSNPTRNAELRNSDADYVGTPTRYTNLKRNASEYDVTAPSQHGNHWREETITAFFLEDCWLDIIRHTCIDVFNGNKTQDTASSAFRETALECAAMGMLSANEAEELDTMAWVDTHRMLEGPESTELREEANEGIHPPLSTIEIQELLMNCLIQFFQNRRRFRPASQGWAYRA